MKQKSVIVYSTASCPWCHKAKEWLIENKVKFINKDVGTNAKAAETMMKKSKQSGVPVIEVGKEMVIGFDESKLRKLLL